MSISIRVSIDGVDAYDEDADLVAGHPTLLDGLTLAWGRQSIVDQADTATASFTVRQRITGDSGQVTLFDAIHVGSLVQIWSAESTTAREVLVWAGEVANGDISEVGVNQLQGNVQCVDSSASLQNITVGDEPWPEESAYDRFQRILSAAGLRIHTLRPTGWMWTVTGDIDETLRDYQVAFRDVDAQSPWDLIKGLAETVGGTAWVTADSSGPFVWIEDPASRRGLRQFFINPTTDQVTIGQVALDFVGVDEWDADDVIPSSAVWTQDPSQSINLIDVNWQRPAGVNDQGNPAYTPVVLEQYDSTSDKGIRAFQIDTDLIWMSDASQMAYRWLLQVHSGDWLVSGFAIDTAAVLGRTADPVTLADRLIRLMDLLDVQLRIGYRLTVTSMPSWSPAGSEQSFYIEGGTYTWGQGRWRLELIGSSNATGGGATFRDFEGTNVTFADFSPTSLAFIDIAGVAAPGGFPIGFGAGEFGSQPFGR
jgi:hypothetical protein